MLSYRTVPTVSRGKRELTQWRRKIKGVKTTNIVLPSVQITILGTLFFSSFLLDSPHLINMIEPTDGHQRSPNFRIPFWKIPQQLQVTNLDPGACAINKSSEAHCACLTIAPTFFLQKVGVWGEWQELTHFLLQSNRSGRILTYRKSALFSVRQTFPLWIFCLRIPPPLSLLYDGSFPNTVPVVT